MDDAELLKQFEDLSLPFDQWTHEMHVRIAYTCLSLHPYQHALNRIRRGIKAYNAHHNVPESDTSGYNETTTVAFMRLIDATMRAYGEVMPTAGSTEFCNTHPHLLHKSILRLFYSPAQRMHADAKTKFIEPDLTALPSVPVRSK